MKVIIRILLALALIVVASARSSSVSLTPINNLPSQNAYLAAAVAGKPGVSQGLNLLLFSLFGYLNSYNFFYISTVN